MSVPEIRYQPVVGGWMAIASQPRIAVIGSTTADAKAKINDSLRAWALLREATYVDQLIARAERLGTDLMRVTAERDELRGNA